MAGPTCRFCQTPLSQSFVDLGVSPLSNSYLTAAQLNSMEPFYPLQAYVCTACWLVQLQEVESPESIFRDYAYFSSYSETWLAHARRYVDLMVERFSLGHESQVVEIASNDGYLLQYFKERQVPVLGIEPAANVAAVAIARGIPTLTRFFGLDTAKELKGKRVLADLVVGNNVLAHVPDLNGFVAGLALVLKPNGVVTMEFPHLLRLIQENQFDTVYHEHLSYFSFCAAQKVFAHHGLTLFDVEELPTHGGSLRIYARHESDGSKAITSRTTELKERELRSGLNTLAPYSTFEAKVRATKRALLDLVIHVKGAGKSLVGYGAPAKGNTLLNYCGIRTDFLEYTVDASPHKQGRFLPGTHIPIYHPDRICETRPDYVLILPWNIRDEIMKQMSFVRDWGGAFVVPIPEVTVYP